MNSQKIKLISLRFILVLMFSLILIQCVNNDITTNPEPEVKHWSYDGDTGPAFWGDLDPDNWFCKNGKNQSPIDIVTTSVILSDVPNIQFHYEPSALKIENNGHTIEAVVDSGSYMMINGLQYNLIQFHFHSLSEHKIDGMQYPLEAHFVNQAGNGDYSVIGILFKVGVENPNLKPIWDHMPSKAEEEFDLHTNLNIDNILPSDRRSYQYSGSFTTPPCTEGVKWFMMKSIVDISQAQIDTFKAIYDHNYRPTQSLNARQVILDSN